MKATEAYQADIDGLRGIAVILVLLYHALPTQIYGGFIGVDIFFVISGFLIARQLFCSIANKTFSFVTFYRRRVNRLFPALLIILVCALVFGWFYLTPDEFAKLGKHIFAGGVFVSNLVSLSEYGYFDTASELKPLLHLWSLGIEEQFYIFFPIGIYLTWKLRISFGLLISILLLLSFSLNIYRSSYDTSFSFFSLQTRAWELLTGALIGYMASKRITVPNRLTTGFGVAGLTLIILSVLVIDRHQTYPSGWALMPVLGTALLLLSNGNGWVNKHVLSTKILVKTGLISYPLYLWHWVLLSMVAITFGPVSSSLRLLLVLMSIPLAAGTFQFIEKPLRQHHNTNKIAAVLLLLMLAVAFFGLFIYKSHGFVGQPNFAALSIDSGQSDCATQFKAKNFCVLGNNQTERSILIIGDSHSYHLTAAIEDTFGRDYRIIFSFSPGCFFSFQETFHENSPNCQPFINLIPTLQGTKLEAVIRSQLWHGYPALSDDTTFDRAIFDAAKAFDLGPTKIIIVGSVPNADLTCEKRNYYFGQRDGLRQCDPMLESRFGSARFIDRTKSLALRSNVYFVYPHQRLCNQTSCSVIENGVSYYTDINHLSKAGAMLIMPEIAAILKR